MGGSAIDARDARRVRIERRHAADADIDAAIFYNVSQVTERVCTNPQITLGMRLVEHELVGILLDLFEASENSILIKFIIAFKKE